MTKTLLKGTVSKVAPRARGRGDGADGEGQVRVRANLEDPFVVDLHCVEVGGAPDDGCTQALFMLGLCLGIAWVSRRI